MKANLKIVSKVSYKKMLKGSLPFLDDRTQNSKNVKKNYSLTVYFPFQQIFTSYISLIIFFDRHKRRYVFLNSKTDTYSNDMLLFTITLNRHSCIKHNNPGYNSYLLQAQRSNNYGLNHKYHGNTSLKIAYRFLTYSFNILVHNKYISTFYHKFLQKAKKINLLTTAIVRVHSKYHNCLQIRNLNLSIAGYANIISRTWHYYYRQEFRYSWQSSTRTFKLTEMKVQTIGEQAHDHTQLPPSHSL